MEEILSILTTVFRISSLTENIQPGMEKDLSKQSSGNLGQLLGATSEGSDVDVLSNFWSSLFFYPLH